MFPRIQLLTNLFAYKRGVAVRGRTEFAEFVSTLVRPLGRDRHRVEIIIEIIMILCGGRGGMGDEILESATNYVWQIVGKSAVSRALCTLREFILSDLPRGIELMMSIVLRLGMVLAARAGVGCTLGGEEKQNNPPVYVTVVS